MKPSIPDRLDRIKLELGIKEDVELAKQAGASKSMVNQWFTGGIKSISAIYAYELEKNTGFSARWIQLGDGPARLGKEIVETVQKMSVMQPEQQYLAARLVDQIAQLDTPSTPDRRRENIKVDQDRRSGLGARKPSGGWSGATSKKLSTTNKKNYQK